MPRANAFTPQKQAAFLTYFERANTVKSAAEKAGVSHVTVGTWVREGLKLTDNSAKAEFARKYKAILDGTTGTLTKEDFQLIREQAIRGERRLNPTQLKCIEQLEGRFFDSNKEDELKKSKPVSFADEIVAKRNQKAVK